MFREASQCFPAALFCISALLKCYFHIHLHSPPALLGSTGGCHSNALPYRILLPPPLHSLTSTRSGGGGGSGGIPTAPSSMNNPCGGSRGGNAGKEGNLVDLGLFDGSSRKPDELGISPHLEWNYRAHRRSHAGCCCVFTIVLAGFVLGWSVTCLC